MTPRPPSKRIYLVLGLCVFGVALALRFAYLGQATQLPFFNHPIMDGSYHDSWAREIAGGRLTRGEPFFRAPLYPYLLGLLYRMSEGSYLVPRIVQFMLGALTCVVTMVLARRLIGWTAGIVAGLLCAAYPVLIYFEGELLTETLFTFLLMTSLLLLHRASRRHKTSHWLWAGICLGLALITRPTVGLFLPLALAGCLVLSRRRLLAAVLLVVGIALPVAPVTIHNYAVSGEFIPVVWQGGLNFYLGNNQAADGWSATSPEIRKDWWGGYRDMIAIPREVLGRDPTFNEVSAFWQGKGLDFITGRTAHWIRLMLKKTAIFWSAMEFPNNQDYNFARLHSWVLRNPLVNFGVVGPLCLVGVFALLARPRGLYFTYALLLAYFAGTVAFFVCARYRAPILPVMCIFAGGCVSRSIGLWKARSWTGIAAMGIGIVAAGLLVNINITGEELPDLAQSYTQVGKVYLELGDDEAAVSNFNLALQSNPLWGEAYEQMGVVSMKGGRNEEARHYLVKAVEVQPGQAGAHRSLAMLYLIDGNLTLARQHIETAIRLAPYLEDANNVLGSLQRQEGNLDGAVTSFLRELEINPGNWRAQANLGSSYEEMGDIEKAAAAYEKAVELNRDDPNLVIALASVYSKLGRDDLAGNLLDRLRSDVPQDVNLRYNQAVILQNDGRLDEAKHIYGEILADVPLHRGALTNLGVIYAREGKADEALALWRKVLEIDPGNQTVLRNIRLLEERSQP